MAADAWSDGPPARATAKALLYAHTVRRLRPAQPAHRARLLLQRSLVASAPARARRLLSLPVPDVPGWPAGWRPLDARLPPGCPDPAANAAGTFAFLSETRHVGEDWAQQDAPRLWRFNLHYFEWAWSFAAHPDRDWARAAFGERWRSWRAASPFGVGDAWAPYVVAVRIWAFCGVYGPLVEGTAHERDFAADLAAHAGFLRWHVEHDIGGNHVVKDLKALLGAAVFLRNDGLRDHADRLLRRELGRQVLPDGGHYERSPSYHCDVLGDLIDVAALAEAAGGPSVSGVDDAVAAMRRWLGVLLLPDGDVPFFNDCALLGPARVRLLRPAPRPSRRLVVLPESGYVVARPDDAWHLVANVGWPCPPDLPAHAHADCLSFELAVDGHRVLVNSGTSTYEPGPRRRYERSTRAHNTVEVDGADQTELWQTFRAARRARPCLEHAADVDGVTTIVASHDGYGRLPGSPQHRRTWRLSLDEVEIVDEVHGQGPRTHAIRGFLHAAPDTPVVIEDDASGTLGALTVRVASSDRLVVRGWAPGAGDAGWAALGFGRLAPVGGLELVADARLPVRMSTRLARR